MLLGFMFAILHKGSCPIDYECQECGHRFGKRGLKEKVYLSILILSILLPIIAPIVVLAITWRTI